MDLITLVLICIGSFGLTALLGYRKPENEQWRLLGIKNSKGKYPYVFDKKKSKEGIDYVFYIPTGIDMDKFLEGKKYNNLLKQTFTNMCESEIKIIDGHKLSVKVIYKKLGKKYEYPVQLISESKSILDIPIGVSLDGIVYLKVGDAMPHSIVAGTSGFGKSTAMKCILTFLCVNKEDIDIYLIDMKNGVEFSSYANCVKVKMFAWNKQDATKVIKILVKEMEDRYRIFKEVGVRDIDKYNAKFPNNPIKRIMMLVDEFADLSKEKTAMDNLIEIGRKGRAAGIHMILATQYPTSKIIDTQLKINIIGRVCFKVENYHDSMTILDHIGAEQIDIVGRGIFKKPSVGDIEFQGYYLDDATIDKLIQPVSNPKPLKLLREAVVEDTNGDEYF
jgi:hypothetical protein